MITVPRIPTINTKQRAEQIRDQRDSKRRWPRTDLQDLNPLGFNANENRDSCHQDSERPGECDDSQQLRPVRQKLQRDRGQERQQDWKCEKHH